VTPTSTQQAYTFKNGDRLPLLGLGTWQADPGQVYSVVREAIRVGYRHIDCALLYGNEAEIGRAIGDAIAARDVTRNELWITSKLWSNAHGRKNVGPALQKTLRDLGLDYLDLYLMHWPIPLKSSAMWPGSADDFLPPSEAPLHATWAGLEAACDAGLVRHLGISNFSSKKIRELLPYSRVRPEVNQVELHPFLQQPKLMEYCASEDIHVTAYAPLGSPDRPEFLKTADAPHLLSNPVIRSIADARGCSAAQVLLAWHVQLGRSALPKSVNPARLRENLAASDIELSSSQLEQMAALDRGYRFIAGAFWVVDGGPWSMHTIWDE